MTGKFLNIFKDFRTTLVRFPFAILCSASAAVIMAVLIRYDSPEKMQHLANAVMALFLGLPLMISFTLIAEEYALKKSVNILLKVGGLVLLLLYYLSLPQEMNYVHLTRFTLFVVGLHLFTALSPVTFHRKYFSALGDSQNDIDFKNNALWNCNITYLLRILLSGIYSLALYAGLALAVFSINKLFDLDLNGRIYPQLFFIVIGIFNTLFFLSGIPNAREITEKKPALPFGLNLFVKYVLIPLVTIYTIILYSYSVKIIFSWNLPSGWVSYLITGFAITGILSYLLINPLWNNAKEKLFGIFNKSYFIVLLPLLVLLYISIITRINQYGITEKRYYILILALWLTLMALYFIISKKKNIKYIPLSLAVIAFLSSYGPWGAFQMSKNNQLARFEDILERNNLIEAGKLKKSSGNVSKTDEANISSILTFFGVRGELKEIDKWLGIPSETLKTTNKEGSHKSRESQIMEMMGLSYTFGVYSDEQREFNYRLNDSLAVNINGYDIMKKFSFYYKEEDRATLEFDTGISKTNLIMNFADSKLTVERPGAEALAFNIENFINGKKVQAAGSTEQRFLQRDLILEAENKNFKVKLLITNISGDMKKENKALLRSISADLFLKVKE